MSPLPGLPQAMPFSGATGGAGGLRAMPGMSQVPVLNPNGPPAAPDAPGRDPHTVLPQPPSGKAAIGVSARFGADGAVIPRGLVWRVFADKPEASGAYPLVAEAVDPSPVFFLSPGGYVVHVAYGLASAAQRIIVGASSRREQLVLDAGAMKLQADVNDKLIPAQKISFDLFEGSFLQGKPSSRPYFRGIGSGEVLILPSGNYHVVATYGDGNAVIQADLSVQDGKLTDATIHQRAAEITLKLVSQAGTTPLGDTQWSILSPGGDSIKEAGGSTPAFVLAEGGYIAIARHDGKTYSKEFDVEAGKDQSVELTLTANEGLPQQPSGDSSGDGGGSDSGGQD
nr:hypothetical protein [Ancylobacter crimeensis]